MSEPRPRITPTHHDARRVTLGALDLSDGGRAAQARDDVREMAHVPHLDVHQHLEEILLPVDDLEVAHRAVLLGDRVGEAGERAGLVRCDHADPAGMQPLPFPSDPPF